MSDHDQNTPTTGEDGTDSEKLGDLIERVDREHGEDGAAAMADELRGQVEETNAEPEDAGDVED